MNNMNVFAVTLIVAGLVAFSGYAYSNFYSSDSGIITKVELENSSFEASDDWDSFETVIIDTKRFEESAKDGTVTLQLLGEKFKIKFHEISRLDYSDSYYYEGNVVGEPETGVSLYVGDGHLGGSIEPENAAYNIAPTDEIYEGKTVHVAFMIDFEKEKERFKQKYSVDPLQFFLSNSDVEEHELSIEIFDFNNISIFKEAYILSPGDEISSPEIVAELGVHTYVIVLDNDAPYKQTARVDYATELGSTEKIYINLIDHPVYPFEIGIEVA